MYKAEARGETMEMKEEEEMEEEEEEEEESESESEDSDESEESEDEDPLQGIQPPKYRLVIMFSIPAKHEKEIINDNNEDSLILGKQDSLQSRYSDFLKDTVRFNVQLLEDTSGFYFICVFFLCVCVLCFVFCILYFVYLRWCVHVSNRAGFVKM